MESEELLTLISNELSQVDSGIDNETALSYYLGLPNGTEVEGKSQVTSTDVADAIEWIMPQVMKSFTQTNEVVVFDPVRPGDEKQAELESVYTYEVLMKQNDGFVLIHQFSKDALLQNNGIMKVYYEDDIEETITEYTGVIAEQIVELHQNPNAEITAFTEYTDPMTGMQFADLQVKYTHQRGRIIVESVPVEEFRICSKHNSINPEKARFTAHVVERTVSDLVKDGHSLETILNLPEGVMFEESDYRFSMQGEESTGNDTVDVSQKVIQVAECYIQMEVGNSGVSALHKVLAAGGDDPSHILEVEQIDSSPWIATTAILMSHKFRGLSIFDRIKQIQDQKTSLWRNMFDNIYLQNNQRTIVLEGQVNMDDLLVSRPGGIVRAKRLDAVAPMVTPSLGQDAQNMMSYLDTVKAGRVGVSAEGGATPQAIGENVGSQGLDRMMNAKEELVGLIIRVLAETGIKPLCVKIRNLAIKHIDTMEDYKFKGEWVKTQPSAWTPRMNSTVRVGTGTGDHMAQVGAIREILALQEKAIAAPGQIIVDQQQMYDTIDDFCKFSGLNGATRYFIDPSSEMGQQKNQESQQAQQAQQQKDEKMQAEMTAVNNKLADAEGQKAQAQMANVQLKAQNDGNKLQAQQTKDMHDLEIKSLEQDLKEAGMIADSSGKDEELQLKYDELEFKYIELKDDTALRLTQIEAGFKKDSVTDENENFKGNKETTDDTRS